MSPMRAALYARVSTHDQHTMAMQMDALHCGVCRSLPCDTRSYGWPRQLPRCVHHTFGAITIERLGPATLPHPCISLCSPTTRDGYIPLLCANHQILKGLLILEPVQFCPACPRDFNALLNG